MLPVGYLPGLSQLDISTCPTVTGLSPTSPLLHDLPANVLLNLHALPWSNTRQHRTVLIRPQDCRMADVRMGAFWHRDVDVHGVVTPNWADLVLTLVTFGDVAETEFIPNTGLLGAPVPSLACYTDVEAQHVNGRDWPTAVTIRPNQVVRYGSRDWHRAGPIRRPAWRLVMIGVESDHVAPSGMVRYPNVTRP